MTTKDFLSYWQKTAQEDLKTALSLCNLKRYQHSLFFAHLALEKLLKGLVYKKTQKHAFPIHNLVKLAQQAKIQLTKGQKNDLEEITTWNIQARYDTIKRDFYKKATKEFTLKWLTKVEEFFSWLKKQY